MNWKRRSIAALGVAAGGEFLAHYYVAAGILPVADPVKSPSLTEAPDSIHRVYDAQLTSAWRHEEL